jgi:predicted metal-dependent RNase
MEKINKIQKSNIFLGGSVNEAKHAHNKSLNNDLSHLIYKKKSMPLNENFSDFNIFSINIQNTL